MKAESKSSAEYAAAIIAQLGDQSADAAILVVLDRRGMVEWAITSKELPHIKAHALEQAAIIRNKK